MTKGERVIFSLKLCDVIYGQPLTEARRERGRGKFSLGPMTFGAPQSLKNINYTRMCHFEKQNSKIVSSDRFHKNVFLGPTVALDVPALTVWHCGRDP